ncbi:MAG TPA: MFS transporter [Terriglobia bacterium]|nr:MFS transporter [Terriglobia bacterium]
MKLPGTDTALLFATRISRLFAYGLLSIVLALYLAQIGLTDQRIGLLLSLTLAGDVAISLWITTVADHIGRRFMLIVGAALMILASVTFAFTDNFWLLTLAAIVGIISPSGNEIGPFLSIEQAALSQLVPSRKRTGVFAWYNLVGSFSTALGALAGGGLIHSLQVAEVSLLAAYRAILIAYSAIGVLLVLLFACLSPAIETVRILQGASGKRLLGLHQSRKVVIHLSRLFALDAFAGGFIVQSIMAYWFHVKFGLAPATLGSIFFGANLLAGISSLLSVRLAARIGLINTMVFTHIPSNILLILVPLMPHAWLAILVLLLRFSISQMDVPTRQSYTMAVVCPDERSAASGVTNVARSVGASLAPALSGQFMALPALLGFPFFLAGGLKIVYDLLLFRDFRSLKPPEEKPLD